MAIREMKADGKDKKKMTQFLSDKMQEQLAKNELNGDDDKDSGDSGDEEQK